MKTHDPRLADDPATAHALTALQNQFPEFGIWSENKGGGRRYIARRRGT